MRARKDINADLEKLDKKLFLVSLKSKLKKQNCENDSEELDIYCKMTDLRIELRKLDWEIR